MAEMYIPIETRRQNMFIDSTESGLSAGWTGKMGGAETGI